MANDPFFQAARGGRLWGLQSSYLEDISRTYGKPLGPQLAGRADETYTRALRFRQQEKEHYRRMEAENRNVQTEYNQLQEQFATLGAELSKLREEKANAVPTRSHSDRVDAHAPDEPDEEPKADEHSGSGLPDATLPDDGADPHRSPREHDAQGRQTGTDDSAGSVEQPEEPVHEGGE